jgi:hypothetical protein
MLNIYNDSHATYNAWKSGDTKQMGYAAAKVLALIGPLALERLRLGLVIAEDAVIARDISGGRNAALANGTMDTSLANGDTVRHSVTATAIGDDSATLTNFNRSRGSQGHDVIVHGNFDANGEVQFVTNGHLHPYAADRRCSPCKPRIHTRDAD